MAASPSEAKRLHVIGQKDALADALIVDIVSMLDELDRTGLNEVKGILEVKLREATAKAEECKTDTKLR